MLIISLQILFVKFYHASTTSSISYQALLESMGVNVTLGPDAVAAAEKNAAILTAKAGARDPSAIPSICRVSAALQYPTGEGPFKK